MFKSFMLKIIGHNVYINYEGLYKEKSHKDSIKNPHDSRRLHIFVKILFF